MNPKYRIMRVVEGDKSTHFEIQKRGVFGWRYIVDYYGSGYTEHKRFGSLVAAEQYILDRAEPSIEMVKEYPQMCVVSLDLDDYTIKELQRLADERGVTVDDIANMALQNFILNKNPKTDKKNKSKK